GKRLLPIRVAARHQIAEELLVLLAADKVPAATQTQGLVHGGLEMPVGGFHVAVLMGLADVDPLTLQTVIRQEVPVALLKFPLRGEIVDRRRKAIAAVATG